MKARPKRGPWCACVKVRLAGKKDSKIRQDKSRVSIHAFNKCIHYRAGIAGVGHGDEILLKFLNV